MRILLPSLLLFMPFMAHAQDSLLVDERVLEQRVDSFALVVRQHAGTLLGSTEMDDINVLAQELVDGATDLLKQVEKVHPPDQDLLFEIELQRNMSLSMLNTEPALATEYQVRAGTAQDQLDAGMPPYYRQLRQIMELSRRIAGARRMDRAQRLAEQFQELEITVGREPE